MRKKSTPSSTSPPPPSLSTLISAIGVSQGAFARSIGVDPSYISHVLAGRKSPSLRRAVMMAGILKVSLDVLNRSFPRRLNLD